MGISEEHKSLSNTSEQLEKLPASFNLTPEQDMLIFHPLALEELVTIQRSQEELYRLDGTTTGILQLGLMSLERVDEFRVGRFVAEAASSNGAARACAYDELAILLSR